MEKPILTDKSVYPTDEVLRFHLGDRKPVWDAMFILITKHYPSFVFEWRYYNDGKCWLHKVTTKSKTVCWISVYPNLFKMTFYFGDKAEPLIVASTLKEEFKNQYLQGKKVGKIRPILVSVQNTTVFSEILKLIELKEKIK
jgi:hypothetical protein